MNEKIKNILIILVVLAVITAIVGLFLFLFSVNGGGYVLLGGLTTFLLILFTASILENTT